MTQRQIDAAYTRSLKPSYKHLTPPQKRIIKAIEKNQLNNRELYKIEKSLIFKFGDNWRRNDKAKTTIDYALFFEILLDIERQNKKISYQESKYNLDRKEVLNIHNQARPGYYGSF